MRISFYGAARTVTGRHTHVSVGRGPVALHRRVRARALRKWTMRRTGLVLIELLTVLCVIAILAGIALPFGLRARHRADAVHVVADFSAIRFAAQEKFSRTGAWPPTEAWGTVPAQLVDALPDGFAFRYRDVLYRWRNWPLGGSGGAAPVLVALEVSTADAALLRAVREAFGGTAFGTNTQLTLVIE